MGPVTVEDLQNTSEQSQDDSNEPPTPKPEVERQTRWPRRVKKAFKRVMVRLAVFTLPRIYLTYMWFVYKTSKVEEIGWRPSDMREQCGEGLWAIWHDEVFLVAYAFGKYHPHTLASRGDFGELVSRLLELCHFTTFRGGSSSSRKRRSSEILNDMIECMNSEDGVLYGITTDGSVGPAYRMKKGAVRIAMACQAPIGVQRTWCKRYVQLPTWDQTFVPLPFNHILHIYQGPFYPPKKEEGAKTMAEYAEEVERALCRLSGHARRQIEGKLPQKWIERFPEAFREEVTKEEAPELFLPIDESYRKKRGESGPTEA